MAAPVEGAQEPVAASEPVTDAPVTKPEEKAVRPGKRGSIFGRMGSGWGSLKSPSKEKELKDAELKPDVPPKDAGVSETAPQIPEPAAETTTDAAAPPAIETTEPTSEAKPAEAAKEQLDAVSPNAQPKGFLSGLPFLNKRGRSVSPSATMKEAPAAKQEETPVVPAKDETAVDAPAAAVEEPTTSVPETSTATDPVKQTEEPVKTETTSPTANKRESMFSNLGRRASKAFKGYQSPRKENAVPATTQPKTEEVTEAAPAAAEADKPIINGESKALETEQQPSSIGDVVPDAVNAGQPEHSTPTVTASA